MECVDLRKIIRRNLSIYEYIKKFAFLKLKRGWELVSKICLNYRIDTVLVHCRDNNSFLVLISVFP